jgi:hypothetical protein
MLFWIAGFINYKSTTVLKQFDLVDPVFAAGLHVTFGVLAQT